MAFIKHIGKHGDRKVAVVYRTVPGEEHMALVIYPETLSAAFHDAVIKVIESDIGQDADSLSDAFFKSKLSDGRPMLQTLHKEGKMKKVNTNQIVITPNATSHVRLDELNKIFDGIEAGGDAAEKMADLDAHAGLVDPTSNRVDNEVIGEQGGDVIDDAKLGTQMLDQSAQMAAEGTALVAESKRLQKEAFKLNPELKPKRKTAKKSAKQKSEFSKRIRK